MTFDIGGVIGLVIVVGVFGFTAGRWLAPILFRYVRLPRLAREHGWLVKTRGAWGRQPADLPGSGSADWAHSLPEMECEFLGTYRHQPVHGIEIAVRRRTFDAVYENWTTKVRRYSVVTVATSARPFGGFHAGGGGRAFTGDARAFYPDFLDWARNRRPEQREPLAQEGPGLRSVSWQGRLTRQRVLHSLDQLTGARTWG
ncbi:hypothetical protein SAMN05421810_11149 [Amycolatopsis arida]|uniref:Uncharacterized protein n=1 Tax=Amycolatopsis arida TaxID=587909 RepID=A0A1I6A3J5_9PSEU|nr:hypothetical protein [Amycolatopsis arida]TDX88642.1 hypothetical protein CLV69_111164 [Amycolatopsis arida]SFQ63235.1 hypothetical protein SAMN05421810_11149 [Amycolatopsis arida]